MVLFPIVYVITSVRETLCAFTVPAIFCILVFIIMHLCSKVIFFRIKLTVVCSSACALNTYVLGMFYLRLLIGLEHLGFWHLLYLPFVSFSGCFYSENPVFGITNSHRVFFQCSFQMFSVYASLLGSWHRFARFQKLFRACETLMGLLFNYILFEVIFS